MPGDFRAEVGHRFTLRDTPNPHWNGITEGEVLEVRPHARLVYRWRTMGAAGDGLTTIVTWTLEPKDAGAMVRMEQSGFRPQDTPNFEGTSVAWQRFLARLEEHLFSDSS